MVLNLSLKCNKCSHTGEACAGLDPVAGIQNIRSFNTLDSGSSPGSTKPVLGLTRYPGFARNDSVFGLSKRYSCQIAVVRDDKVMIAVLTQRRDIKSLIKTIKKGQNKLTLFRLSTYYLENYILFIKK